MPESRARSSPRAARSPPRYFLQYGGTNAQQLHAPNGLAVDPTGNLWVANLHSVLEYSTATLATLTPGAGGTSPIAADAYLSTTASEAAAQNLNSGSAGIAPLFHYVAFDATGNLWLGANADLFRYPAASLTPTATNPTYDIFAPNLVTLTSNSLAFNPLPTGLPLQP